MHKLEQMIPAVVLVLCTMSFIPAKANGSNISTPQDQTSSDIPHFHKKFYPLIFTGFVRPDIDALFTSEISPQSTLDNTPLIRLLPSQPIMASNTQRVVSSSSEKWDHDYSPVGRTEKLHTDNRYDWDWEKNTAYHSQPIVLLI